MKEFKKLTPSQDNIAMVAHGVQSDFWAWLKADLEARISQGQNRMCIGDYDPRNPEEFWELRGVVKGMMATLHLPEVALQRMQAKYQKAKTMQEFKDQLAGNDLLPKNLLEL